MGNFWKLHVPRAKSHTRETEIDTSLHRGILLVLSEGLVACVLVASDWELFQFFVPTLSFSCTFLFGQFGELADILR